MSGADYLTRIRDKLVELSASHTSKAVYREGLTYCSLRKLARLERCVDVALSREVAGAVVEFGVALGGSAIVRAKRCRERKFYGFDVFGMIPPPTSEKDDSVSRDRFEVIASGQSRGIGDALYYGYRNDLYTEVVGAFERHGCSIDGRRVFIHKGLFQHTWSDFPTDQLIAVAHIDCDWYDPVTFCLKVLKSRLVKGSTLIFDDFYDYGGARTAVTEFLSIHKSQFDIDMGKNVILIHK